MLFEALRRKALAFSQINNAATESLIELVTRKRPVVDLEPQTGALYNRAHMLANR